MSLPEANQEAAHRRGNPGASLDQGGLGCPERSALDMGIALALCAVSILFLWPFANHTGLYPDEGIILQGAERIVHGEVPYRDFFTFYTPLSYYWTALRLSVFGNSFFVARAILLVYGGVFSMVIYLVARRVCSRDVSILTAYLFLATGLPHRFTVLHNWDGAFWAALAFYAGVRWLQWRHPLGALATGTLASLTVLTNQSMGAGFLLGLGVAGLILIWRQPGLPALRRAHFAGLLAGLIWPWVVVVVYFSSQSALTAMLADLIWPLQHYSGINRLPYGYISMTYEAWESLYGSGPWVRRLLYMLITSPLFLVPSLPFVALAFLGYCVVPKRSGFAAEERGAYFVTVCACGLGGVLSTVAAGRPDINHLFYVSLPLYVMLGWILGAKPIGSALLAKTRPLLVAFLLVSFTAFGMVYLVSGPLVAGQRLETRRGTVRLPCCDAVIPYLAAHVPRGEKIFVYPYQPLYYFLTDTSSPAPFDYLQLGMHTDEQMKEAIAAVESGQTRYVVYALAFNSAIVPEVWPSTSQRALAKDPVRDYILTHYRPCTVLPSLALSNVFLVRTGYPCPGETVPGRG
jgi:4-amino-4-deoxy-L-arabinose transferase-like glycosyltransferase